MSRLQQLLFRAAILLFFMGVIACEEENEAIGPDGRTETEVRALDLINSHRSSLGLPPLEHSEIVYQEAKSHSANMASLQVAFGHDGFSERVNRIRTQLTIGAAGENVAYNSSPTPSITVVDQWLNSQGHRDNIEDERFTHCGLAAVPDGTGAYYFTHILVQMNE